MCCEATLATRSREKRVRLRLSMRLADCSAIMREFWQPIGYRCGVTTTLARSTAWESNWSKKRDQRLEAASREMSRRAVQQRRIATFALLNTTSSFLGSLRSSVNEIQRE